MYVLIGLAIAALLGNSRQTDSLAPLRSLTAGPIRVAHAIPGRVRFVVPSLRGAGADDLGAIERLGSLDGFESVDVSAVSGSVVVRYRPEQIDPPLLLGAVARLLGLEAELERIPTPAVTRELHLLTQSVDQAIFHRTHGVLDLSSLTALILMALGGRKVVTQGWRSLPTGVTLLWWGLHSLRAKDDAGP